MRPFYWLGLDGNSLCMFSASFQLVLVSDFYSVFLAGSLTQTLIKIKLV